MQTPTSPKQQSQASRAFWDRLTPEEKAEKLASVRAGQRSYISTQKKAMRFLAFAAERYPAILKEFERQ